jgi:phosphate transport system substrate-binding protein
LGIQLPSGEVVHAVPEDVASGKYPMMRPVMLVSGDPPTGAIKKLFDFLSSSRGQDWVSKASLMPIRPNSKP